MPQPCPQRVRRGVTLLELLVVLTLMGVAAALVAPALGVGPAFARSSGGREDPVSAVLTSARRQAIRRAEPLRLRMAGDGVWALASQRSGAILDSGRVRLADDAAAAPVLVDVLIDVLGTCLPPAGTVSDVALDALACRSGSALDSAHAEAR